MIVSCFLRRFNLHTQWDFDFVRPFVGVFFGGEMQNLLSQCQDQAEQDMYIVDHRRASRNHIHMVYKYQKYQK